jgi:cobalt-precorrin 5A hydrolase / cobalt-factor III methyltransferase / precorrin-3B C17-methyltransferase
MNGIVLVALTARGADLAHRLAAAIPGAHVHGLATRIDRADETFQDTTAHLRRLFAAGRPIVAVCAAGIAVRAVAPLLADKHAEPPVVALSEDGRTVVPLLGGHRGGDALARRIGELLEIEPAITAAGDSRFGVALDDPPTGWRLANPRDYKNFAARLLAGARVRMEGVAPWLAESSLPFAEDAPLKITVTEHARARSADELVYRPAVLAVGVGCERGTDPAELASLVHEVLTETDLAPEAVAGIYSLDLKADEPAVHALAAELGVAARFFDAASLEAEAPRLATPSDAVYHEVGCHGVAEGAALAAAGAEARLVAPKRKSARATCAIAVAPVPIGAVGQGRGSLALVGLGPGHAAWRTPEAEAAIARASDLVGYGLYLDLLGRAAAGKTRHAYALGEEEVRVRAALDLAATGRDVALVCSGDPGIYALATLVFEMLEYGDRPEWRRPEITVLPGISALQAAAARAGAPLGHDFCAISLSDLLTPWPAIERRLRAAAEGDFVVALYNPVSRKRRRQFEMAVEILRDHRPAATPVILARNLGRDGESVRITDLAHITVDRVDMLTVVLIGSSQTRCLARGDGGTWVYTPRGYAAKRAATTGEAAE